MAKKSRVKFYLSLVIFSLTGQIAWVVENMYFNVFLYRMFGAGPGEISLMVSASAAAATLTTLLIGALADKLGRRRAFICGGYILWGLSIFAFTLLREDIIGALFPMAASVSALCITLVIILDCVMTFFGSSANDAAFNAWLTDVTTPADRGAAEGINAMMPLVAILAVFGGFMGFDLSLESSWTVIFAVIGIGVTVIGLLGFFLIDEPKLARGEGHYFANIVYGFRPSVMRQNKGLYGYLIAFAVFGISIQIFMPYLILYYTVTLKMDNYVMVMAPAIILAAIFTALWGRVYDRVGFSRAAWPAIGLLGAGYVILYFTRTTVPVFIGSLFMMCGYLAGMAVFGAIIRDRTPVGRSGQFQGLRIVSQVLIPGLIGPAIGAFVLRNAEQIAGDDGTLAFVPNVNIFLAAFAVLIVLAVIVICGMRNQQRSAS